MISGSKVNYHVLFGLDHLPGVQIPSLRCPPTGWRGGVLCLPAVPDSSSNHNPLSSVKSEVSGSTQFGVFLIYFSLAFFFVSHPLVFSRHTYTHTRVHTPARFEAWASLYLAGPSPNTALSTPLPNFAWPDSHWPGFVLSTTGFPCLSRPCSSEGEESGGRVSPMHPSSGQDRHPSQVAWDILGL